MVASTAVLEAADVVIEAVVIGAVAEGEAGRVDARMRKRNGYPAQSWGDLSLRYFRRKQRLSCTTSQAGLDSCNTPARFPFLTPFPWSGQDQVYRADISFLFASQGAPDCRIFPGLEFEGRGHEDHASAKADARWTEDQVQGGSRLYIGRFTVANSAAPFCVRICVMILLLARNSRWAWLALGNLFECCIWQEWL